MGQKNAFAGYINGEWLAGQGSELIVENPSDESRLAEFPGVSRHQIEAAIGVARKAFDSGSWSEMRSQERAVILKRFAAALAQRAEKIQQLVVSEAGCPRYTSVINSQIQVPLKQAPEIIDFFLSLPEIEENPLPLAERITATGQSVQSLRRYSPVGVVAAIAAYNFPFLTALWKVMPALIAGNTVILRPSPLTPLSALIFAEAAEEALLPKGVLNIVLEAGVDGAQLLTTHPDIDLVAFTGSTGVGAQVMAQAAPTLKRLQLELGGKSAQIFLPDALDRVVMSTLGVCLAHAGQGCALGTRIFVPQEQKQAILQQIAQAISKIRIGPADSQETQLGPVISAAQRQRCEKYVAAAIEHGGIVVSGGKRPAHLQKGYFFEPTVLDVPDNSNPAAQDEIFGPVVTVIGYDSLDHAVAMANDSRFGLSGYVHGKDARQAFNIATRIKSGTVNVNAGLMSTYISSGGQRFSGIGRERGIEGLRLYQQLTCLNLGG
jgi:aldehyde dehydrogenase (NAD+)